MTSSNRTTQAVKLIEQHIREVHCLSCVDVESIPAIIEKYRRMEEALGVGPDSPLGAAIAILNDFARNKHLKSWARLDLNALIAEVYALLAQDHQQRRDALAFDPLAPSSR